MLDPARIFNCGGGLSRATVRKSQPMMNISPSSPVLPAANANPFGAGIGPAQGRNPRAVDASPPLQNSVPGELTGSEDKQVSLGQKPIAPPAPNHESDVAKAVIYGAVTVTPPTASTRVAAPAVWLSRQQPRIAGISLGFIHASNGKPILLFIRFRPRRRSG